MSMKVIAISGAIVLASLSGSANAKGCLKGAAVGGVAGHVAGHHGLLGAAAGCAVGHYRANKISKDGQATEKARPAAPENAPAGTAKDKHST